METKNLLVSCNFNFNIKISHEKIKYFDYLTCKYEDKTGISHYHKPFKEHAYQKQIRFKYYNIY